MEAVNLPNIEASAQYVPSAIVTAASSGVSTKVGWRQLVAPAGLEESHANNMLL